MKAPDPKERVGVTRITKRGEYYTVEGVVEGRKTTVYIPAPSFEERPRRDAEALARRSLLGSKRMEDRGEHRQP